ncbi:MAG TPA: class I SAM-dependent methyltransferase [Mycobacteriales bacterium]|nr:class I SAM-dependent methyltransferase [Mycobacteriales bacterium]
MTDAQLNQYALPRGPVGYLAGLVMRVGTQPVQAEIADLITPLRSDQRVLEIGFGPGRLIGLIVERAPHVRISGIDPSPVMLRQARQANRQAISHGLVDLRSGHADSLPFDDTSFDAVVAVNNAPVWPDLPAGLREAHRVLRPRGRFVLSWHSAESPRFIQRRLALAPRHLDAVESALRAEFPRVDLRHLTYSVAFVATA